MRPVAFDIGANDCDFLLTLFCWNTLDDIENQLGNQSAVLAAAKTHQPWTRISEVKFTQ